MWYNEFGFTALVVTPTRPATPLRQDCTLQDIFVLWSGNLIFTSSFLNFLPPEVQPIHSGSTLLQCVRESAFFMNSVHLAACRRYPPGLDSGPCDKDAKGTLPPCKVEPLRIARSNNQGTSAGLI
jgi:hypothetical protein